MGNDAEYYQEHRDDPEEWGEPEAPRPRTARRRLAAMVSVRLSADEEAIVRERANQLGLSLSAYLRRAALHDCNADSSVLFVDPRMRNLVTYTSVLASEPMRFYPVPESETTALVG